MKYGLSDLIREVGDDNLKFQVLTSDMTNCTRAKHGHSLVTFATDGITPGEVMRQEYRHQAFVVWLPWDRYEAARAALKARPDEAPT